MQNLGFASTLVFGAILGAGTVGPCCWFAAKLSRAAADRRAAWNTHKTLIGTISSLGLRAVGFGALALTLLVILIMVRSGDQNQRPVDQDQPLPATSSSATRR